ncbi:quinone-dependent dihydroorotate dehydrogenase [Paracoccus sp. P2]|uniref:Dihydroorotate dehydrogenase (quinone) n=1 Tax=Paracoccus pantotrophus TaxID=82367 RepID=A0A7H9BNE8_PARPN|nr:quinone-dependent dihydroorotate dehydrogenase [Paracoccus pantotrophus]MDF3853675.1 quinone-dependent dihydroorotate dehydrogenase [Paracoccus pantotrophus]QLH12837.1 quinone-dependent dihydroorotate dehydrogenase [Paracoccus pantotrophus]RDD96158.1 quinone-dependent dihydroorotate dehydrogenase [Paracoccus pantotrophus]RNI14774.1 quinone-dependent dihydroorotate dehydrogenase [Paracoccus pantotrophus]WGR66448.1 quinone-dependent dihydroorotate dehydrogenase [Paracoccus pantotrophus]
MTPIERLGLAALHRLDPERAHDLSILALRLGLVPLPGKPVTSDRLRTRIAGLELPNPVGLAAGYDKNARALPALMRAGFGFVEIGAATPRPQPGNPKPRLFRLTPDRAIINRFGFNNQGAQAIADRLAQRPAGIPVGLNIGANKDSADRSADFAQVVRIAGLHADFLTVNVSSPNTEKLRDLQGPEALSALLQGVLAARDALPNRPPVFIKIAPDLDDAALANIAAVALAAPVDAIIATNTTLSRDGLASPQANEAGGLSGAPLFDRSTRILARLWRETGGRVPLIGVGGIGSAEQAWQKLRAGASAVQIYSALVYQGFSLAARIARDLDERLARENLTLAELTGSGNADWL